jgi:hypothetical protein
VINVCIHLFGWNISSIQTCTLDGHLHTVTYTKCRINTINSPDDEHRDARNMYRIGINIYEKITVRQVGYLQELNRDARSTKNRKQIMFLEGRKRITKLYPE